MEAYLAETKARLSQAKKSDDLFYYLGNLGAMKITEARLDWLGTVSRHLRSS